MQRRVVITGAGIISPIGNDLESVLKSLRESTSGIEFSDLYKNGGMRSHASGTVKNREELLASIDRKLSRFMGDAAAYAYLAMQQAIEHAGLSAELVSNPRTGIIAGSGGGSPFAQVEGVDVLREKGIRRCGAFRVPRVMSSTVSANLATAFGIQGVNYSITSACATSAHSVGAGFEQIAWGKQDIVFAGGGEEESVELAAFFDSMGALTTGHNDTPTTASRPYDKTRDGFVAAGGGAMVVLEEYEHAVARGANILAEVVGYGATSDGADMVAPNGEGARRCMEQAIATVDTPIDYINTHGTSTPVGDVIELGALRATFGDNIPPLSSTKALTGHSLGATGAQEVIYSMLMLNNGFISPSAHITELDPAAEGFPLVREYTEVELRTVMSNSFGFGGTNATVVIRSI